MEMIKKVFKYYIVYFIFMFTIFFCLAYFYFMPFIVNDKAIMLGENNTYTLLKKENIHINDETAKNYIEQRLSYYYKYLDKEKIKIDDTLEKKRILVKNGLASEYSQNSECSINYFIEKADILGEDDLVKEYTKLRKKEMPECINKAY